MGVSYLDMGDAFFRGDWATAINGLWSPLYSLPLGLALRILKPSASFEFPLVHLVNYAIYLCALIAFDFFLKELIRVRRERALSRIDEHTVALPEWAWQLLGYALFVWSSLGLITLGATAPDMLVSVFVYLALAQVLRISRGAQSRWSFFILGLILGIGYLAKAPMLPLSVVFLLVGIFWVGVLRSAAPRVMVMVLGLVLAAGPFIVALSASKGRLTFGESGRLNYLWHVNRIPFFHWQGGDTRFGVPAHPTRKILDNPSIYEFGTPMNVTYAPWYDPSYWYEGVTPRLDRRQQTTALMANARMYFEIFTHNSQLILLAGFLLLLYVGRRRWLKELSKEWGLIVLSIAAFALYLPVHVEPRYIAPFITSFWLGLFSTLKLPARKNQRSGTSGPGNLSARKKLIAWVIVPVVSLVLLAAIARSMDAFYSSFTKMPGGERDNTKVYLEVADALGRKGIQPGDPVGMVNFDSRWLPVVHWARLARVHIVAELPNTDAGTFAAADDSRRREVIDAFAKTGAKAVIATRVPENVTLPGWEQVGQTDYYTLKLSQP